MKQILTIKPNVFLWKNADMALLYDSESYNYHEFRLSDSTSSFCEEISDYDNLYSVNYDNSTANKDVADLVKIITDKGFGVLHDESANCISLPPLLNIQRRRKLPEKVYGENSDHTLRYLSEVIIFTGGRSRGNDYYKQIDYPINTSEVLTSDDIIAFIRNIDSPYITKINIVFSDFKNYPNLDRLLEFLSGIKDKILLSVLYEDLIGNGIIKSTENLGLKINVLFDVKENPECDKLYDSNFMYTFVITLESEYDKADEMARISGIEDINVIPVYNGGNFEFFRKNVFLSKDEILDSRLSKREIFSHQVLNTVNFGKIYLLPDRKVYSDTGILESVGSIDSSVYEIIDAELEKNHSWMRIRDAGKCKECLYRFLCPSPSRYERIMNMECICN